VSGRTSREAPRVDDRPKADHRTRGRLVSPDGDGEPGFAVPAVRIEPMTVVSFNSLTVSPPAPALWLGEVGGVDSLASDSGRRPRVAWPSAFWSHRPIGVARRCG
jgi:hypothetical protein